MVKLLEIMFLLALISACKTIKHPEFDNKLFSRLNLMGYFDYATQESKEKLRTLDIKKLLSLNSMIEYYDEKTFEPLTKRVYIIDGEFLSDWGGIEDFLTKGIAPYCKAANFEMVMGEHLIVFDTTTYIRNESLIINQREYNIFKNDNCRYGEGWYLAPIRIANMINNELEIQGKADSFFLINSGNDLSGAFLSQEQYEFFQNEIEDKYWRPQMIHDWIKLYDDIKIKN